MGYIFYFDAMMVFTKFTGGHLELLCMKCWWDIHLFILMIQCWLVGR